MRSAPTDDSDKKELERLNAEAWMVELLDLNPSYVFWGPHEDYMSKDEGSGWDSRVLLKTWPEMWNLDELNEVVNFYFQISRASVNCIHCGGSGTHPHALWVKDSWYHHSSPFSHMTVGEVQAKAVLDSFGGWRHDEVLGRDAYPSEETLSKYSPEFREFCEAMRDGDGCWADKLTQDEVDALVERGRLRDLTHEFIPGTGWQQKETTITAAQVNQWSRRKTGMGHDSINSWIAVSQRCKRFGIPEECPECDGHGRDFTEPSAHVSLILWILHPRKGCSRGVEIERIEESELPLVFAFLKEASERNAKRFAGVVAKV